MNSNPQPAVGSSPRPWDLVLGGQAAASGAPPYALVLGGLEGARRRLTRGEEAVRLATLPQLLQYGPAGLAELVAALAGNSSWAVRLAAWRLLSQLEQPEAEEACPTAPFGRWEEHRG
jgi:hypothetical protein